MEDITGASASKTPLTFEELDALVDTLAEKQKAADVVGKELTALNKEIGELKAKASQYLLELERTSYTAKNGWRIERREITSVSMPKNHDDREAFFNYLRERGVYDTYITVNSQSLNAFYKVEREEAEKRGEDMVLFHIPGLPEPRSYFTASVVKPRK